MEMHGLHILLTYQCIFECDHCFVWGSPWQTGVFTMHKLRQVFDQTKELGTVEWIFFEGGEPFLYHGLLQQAVEEANALGFRVGIVSNAYWAMSVEDAELYLRPLAGLVQDLSVSSDLFHYSEMISQQSHNATLAAESLGIPVGTISIASPETSDAQYTSGTLPEGDSGVMYRGRAAQKLASRAHKQDWHIYTSCPYEDLRDPGRLHLDPYGYLHICQGISLGNLFETPLKEILSRYDPDSHPITGPLLAGGPAELARCYKVVPEAIYADACQLCDQTRLHLRNRFPSLLAPDQMYGVLQG
jgi:Radical SAM superfamily